jgi:hypothetical protein
MEQNQNRGLISAANFEQNPNPGSVSRRAGREAFDVSPRVAGAGGPFANHGIPPAEIQANSLKKTKVSKSQKNRNKKTQHPQRRHTVPRPAEGGAAVGVAMCSMF